MRARMRRGSLLKFRRRSATSTASSILCETITIPLVGIRLASHRSRRSPRKVSAVSTSSEENGSASSSMSGVTKRAPAKPTRFRKPPDTSLRKAGPKPPDPDQSIAATAAPPPPTPRMPAARDAERLEAELDIAEHGQPREKRVGLKNHGDALGGLGYLMPAVFDHPIARWHETGEDAQKGRFART